MDYHWDSAAEKSVRPKLGTMAHTVMAAVSCNGNTSLEGLQLGKHPTLIFLPIEINQWEKLGLKKEHTKSKNHTLIRKEQAIIFFSMVSNYDKKFLAQLKNNKTSLSS